MFEFCRKKNIQKSGVIKKQISYMMAVSKETEVIDSYKEIIKRLNDNTNFKVNYIQAEKDFGLTLYIYSKGYDYKVRILVENYELGDMCKIKHYVSEENYRAILKNKVGITVAMTFNESNLKSFHLQLQILYTIMPNMIAAIDFCTGKILSGTWVGLAANSNVPPSSQYLYSVQAAHEEGIYWVYTCGLNRCGFIEVEILKSTEKYYKRHARVLKMVAQRMILTNTFIKEKEQLWIGKLINGNDIIITWINSKKAVKSYDKNMIGGVKEREEYENNDSGVIYVFPNEKKLKKNKYSHISSINKYITDKLIVTHTKDEIERTRNLALERIDYFIKGRKCKQVIGLIEFAFKIDESSNQNTDKYEHIWFEVKEINKVSVRGKLIQNPYYIKDLKKGEEVEFLLEYAVDWVLYTPYGEITPDKVYLLEEENHYWFSKIFKLTS